jgi:hypothetical protein
VIDQLQISFQVQIREDCCNSLDDVDSCSDTRIPKVRIAIQIQPSGRQSAIVWTHVQQLWKLRVEDQPSRWAKPYMEITCSGRATIRTTVPHHPDASNRKDFQRKSQNFCRTVVRPDGTRIYQSSRPFEPSAYK